MSDVNRHTLSQSTNLRYLDDERYYIALQDCCSDIDSRYAARVMVLIIRTPKVQKWTMARADLLVDAATIRWITTADICKLRRDTVESVVIGPVS